MVRSLVTYEYIKNLCGFFKRTSNTFKVYNETVAVESGLFSGLVFEFNRDLCSVKTGNWHTCFDLPPDFSMDNLVKILVDHNVIRISDVEVD